MGPSRAEMSDNWGSDRKFVPSEDRGGRGGGFGGGFRDRGDRERSGPGPSRADEGDTWGKKAFTPSEEAGSSGRRDRGDRDREGGFGGRGGGRGGFGEPSKADQEERWGHKWEPTKQAEPQGRGMGRGGPGVGRSREDEDSVWKKAPLAETFQDKAKVSDRPDRKPERKEDNRPGIDDDRWGKREVKPAEPRRAAGGDRKKEDKPAAAPAPAPAPAAKKVVEGDDGFVTVVKAK